MNKLLKYMKPFWLSLLVIAVLVTIQAMADLALPDYMAEIVDKGVIHGDNNYILQSGMTMLGIALLGAAASVGVGYLATKVATGFARDIRARVFARVESFSLIEFNRFSTASLITRSTNDIQQIQMVLVMIFRMVLTAPIIGFGAIHKAYGLAPSMTWIMALAVTVLVGVIAVLFSVALPKFKLLQTLVDRLNLVTREVLTGLRVIRAFNRQDTEQVKFDQANQDLTQTQLYVSRLMVVMQPFMMLIFNLTAVLVIWVGSHLVGTGDLMIGDMIAFMQYSMQVIMSFLMISFVFIMLPRASVSASRVAEVLETEPAVRDPEQPKSLPADGTGEVRFDHVSFAYPGAEGSVLKDVSFTAKPGQTTAFIGSTGSGKSTLIGLIPRFYDVTQGQVLVDGVDVREVAQHALRERIGYVPQKGILFSGTVTENLRFGAPEASEQAVKQAVKTAQADFVESLEQGYDTPMSQGGTTVSGGQKQRLSIARAVVRQPKIYIFDDSFSALDFRTDAALRQALKAQTAEATVLIVAQRIGTILHADQIVVLDNGRVVGIGQHAELMQNCAVYQEIAASQLTAEELSAANESPMPISPEVTHE